MIFELWYHIIGIENSDRQIETERDNIMKKAAFVLSIVFIILTFAGAGYILNNDGRVNAGYAVVPMVFALASITIYRNRR